MTGKSLRNILLCDASDQFDVSELVVHLESERLSR